MKTDHLFQFYTSTRKKIEKCYASNHEKFNKLWNTKKIQTGAVFVAFNVGFPLFDLTTDVISAVELYKRTHIKWMALTILWMFGPFLFNILLSIIKFIKKPEWNPNSLVHVFLHFPFILPLTNAILAKHLLLFDLANPENSMTIETIKRSAAISGLYESFLESAPQMVTQIHIILSTGEFPVFQKLQLIVHLGTFTLKACKAFYVQRKSSEADPDPSFRMILLLFPLMLANVINSVAQWTVIAGLLKEFLFIPLFLKIAIKWPLLKKIAEKDKKSEESEDKTDHCGTSDDIHLNERRFSDFRQVTLDKANYSQEDTTFDKIIKKLGKVAEDGEIDEGNFPLKASLTSFWVPCVVGSTKNTLRMSAMICLFARSLIVILAVLFSYSDWYPNHLRGSAYLLHCNTEEKIKELNIKNNVTCHDLWDDCFKEKKMNLMHEIIQLHRVCGVVEDIPITVMGYLIHCFLFSLVSIHFLHRFTSYFNLFEVSKVSCSSDPIIHRSLIHQSIRRGDHETLQELCDTIKQFTDTDITPVGELKEHRIVIEESNEADDNGELVEETMLDRQCPKGYSPLHIAALRKDATSVRILLKSGAKVEQDSTPRHPLTSAFSSDLVCFDMMIKYANNKQAEKAFKQAVEANNIAYCLWLLNHKGSSIPYRSNILLGEISGSKTMQNMKKFDIVGEEKRKIRSITVNFSNVTWVVGLELVWSDGAMEVLGLDKDDDNVVDSDKVDAPQDSSFSFVRGKTADNFIVAMAFDTVTNSGIVVEGEWIRSSGRNMAMKEEAVALKRISVENTADMEEGDTLKRSIGGNRANMAEAVAMRRSYARNRDDLNVDVSVKRSYGGSRTDMKVDIGFRQRSGERLQEVVQETATLKMKNGGRGGENLEVVDDSKKHEVIHTLGMLDIGDSPIGCALDGFKGHLDAYLVNADLINSTYEYRYFLSNLAVAYKITSLSKEQA